MVKEKAGTSLEAAVNRDDGKKRLVELRTSVIEFFQSLSGRALADAVIERLQSYAAQTVGRSIEQGVSKANTDNASERKRVIRNELANYLSNFITDVHREFIVRIHARGQSTSAAVWALMVEDPTMNRLAQEDAMGSKLLKEALILRLAYLKPGTARWPEKKYGAVWHEAREVHKQEMQNIPLTSNVEQVALLAKHAERIERELEDKTHDAKEIQLLTKSLTETMATIRKLTAAEVPVSANVSSPQLVGVLERLTLALKAPDEQKTIGDGSNALPAPVGGDELD